MLADFHELQQKHPDTYGHLADNTPIADLRVFSVEKSGMYVFRV